VTIRSITAALLLCGFSLSANAQLDPFTDYETSDELWNITLVDVDANMGDDYLEGIRETWVAANKVSKDLGYIEDYYIFRSTLPESGDWNLMLVVKFSSLDDLKPSRERYDAFMEAWGEANQDRTREISKDYPSMREIRGETLVREITIN